jgi:ankyrin repeat protein
VACICGIMKTEAVSYFLDKSGETCHSAMLHAGLSGYTPLHYAARGGHLEAVRLLLDAGNPLDPVATAISYHQRCSTRG